MSTFNERFVEAFEAEARRRLDNAEQPLTKTMVWKAAKASSGAFSHWYNGSNGMGLDTCYLVAPILRVNPIWLFYGTGQKELSPSSNTNELKKSAEFSPVDQWGEKPMQLASVSRLKTRSDYVTIYQYADIAGSMGNGLTLPDQPGTIEKWSVSREWMEKNVGPNTGVSNLCIVTGFGPSMQPEYNPGDPLLVDTGVKSVIADGIYFFRIGDEGFIKQLQKIPTEDGIKYIAKSKNPDYDPFEITSRMDFEVLGKVIRVWRGTNF